MCQRRSTQLANRIGRNSMRAEFPFFPASQADEKRNSPSLLGGQTTMCFSLLCAFVALVVAAVSIPEGRCAAPAGRHLDWLDLPPKFTFNAPIDDDVAILNASFGHSFRFIDFNTTDAELLFSLVSGRQAQCQCVQYCFTCLLLVFVER